MNSRLPSVEGYLAELPSGVDSHPQCQVKASVLRDALSSAPLTDVLGLLPAPVARLVDDLPPVSSWVPEVHALTALLAIRDHHFSPGQRGLEEYDAWTYERNRRLLTRPMYRALFLLVSPQRLMSGIDKRWAAFRRGSSLELVTHDETSAEVCVHHPPHLMNELTDVGFRAAMRAAIEAAGGRQVDMTLERESPMRARGIARWSRK